MGTYSRDPQIVTLDVTAGNEANILLAYDIIDFEVQIDTVAGSDARISFVNGGTAAGGNYLTVNPDWWPSTPIARASGTRIYAMDNNINNTFRFILHQA